MAREYSKDTEAIIQRLRDEGDLIRNSGTNSLKTVGSKLDKFGDVFKSINNGIQAQSVMLKQAQSIAEEQYENTKRQQDFDDLKSEKIATDTRKNAEDRDAKLIDGVTKAFNLGNLTKLLVGGAGLAAAGLIGKGFMDEKFPNAFDGIGNVVTELKTSVEGLNTAASELSRTVNEVKNDIESFKNSIAVQLAIALASIPLGFAVTRGLAKGIPAGVTAYRGARQGDAGLAQAKAIKEAQERAAKEAAEAAAKQAAEVAAREAAEAAAKRAAQSAASDDRLIAIAAQQAADVAAREAAEAAARKTAAITASVAAQEAAYTAAADPRRIQPPLLRPPTGMFNSPDALPNIRVTDMGGGRISYQDMSNNGKFMGRDVAVQRLAAAGLGPDGLPDYSRTSRPPRVGPRTGDAGLTETRRMLAQGARDGADLLANADKGLIRKMVASETTKIAIKWIPAVGAVVGLGFAAYSLFIGDYTSAGLETVGVAFPSITGIAADVAAATTSIFFHVGGVGPYNQFNPAHRALYMEIARQLRDSIDKYMEERARAKAQRASEPSPAERMAMEARIQYSNMAHERQDTYYERNESGGFLGMRRYSIYNSSGQFLRYSRSKPDGTTSMDGFRINQARNNYYPSAERQMARAQMVAAGAIGSGGQVNVHMGDTVNAPMSYTEGASSMANVRVNGGVGSGAVADPFDNLPPGIN